MNTYKIFLAMCLSMTAFTGCGDSEGKLNFDGLRNIRLGMKIGEVHSTMPFDPIETEPAYWSDTLFVESYKSVAGRSDHYKIIYSKRDSTVTKVTFGE